MSATSTRYEASYLELARSGELHRRVEQAHDALESCTGCAWKCAVNRLRGERGRCRTGSQAMVSSYMAHLGEEDPLRGWRGSGTVFFASCNLTCQFCQNFEISQAQAGFEVTADHLALIMLQLQADGCHNINLVSPSHVVAQILAGLEIAVQHGLTLPLVYNSGGYDSLETLALLDGVVDIYLPDMKYSDAELAQRYSGIPDYPVHNRAAVKEMHRQVGDLFIDRRGLASAGLLVRHLVLPNHLAGTQEIVRFLAEEVSHNTYLNIMNQYRPAYRASQFSELNRMVTREEYMEAVTWANEAGLNRLDGWR